MVSIGASFVVASVALAPAALAQCPEFGAGFHVAGTDSAVRGLAVADLGSGPQLYLAGDFSTAGTASAARIASWDGAHWNALGSGIGAPSSAPWAMASFDLGGTFLYVGGHFQAAGGVTSPALARWDGSQWSGFGSMQSSAIVQALVVHDDGTGRALYVGGKFADAGGISANCVARWDGFVWSALPNYGWSVVDGMVEFDDGGGLALYVAGRTSSAAEVARWDGTTWNTVGSTSPFFGLFRALAVHDDGSGTALYVAGNFASIDGVQVQSVARFDGSAWSAVGGGILPSVYTLAAFDDGTGAKLYAGTDDAGFLKSWNGASWQTLPLAPDYVPYALAVFDDGSGAALWAGGDFHFAGPTRCTNLAGWDGSAWRTPGPHGNGISGPSATVRSLEVLEDGSGSALFAGGSFLHAGGTDSTSIARFDGGAWSALGSGIDGTVRELAAFDSGAGPELYACGNFDSAGGSQARNIARWNGSAWSALGSGLVNSGGSAEGRALAVFDDGSGAALYAGGSFQSAGGLSSRALARWNGASWEAAGVASGIIDDLAVFDDGSGPALFALGQFVPTPGAAMVRFAKWNGATWSVPASQPSLFPRALEVLDLGAGPALYLAGDFVVSPFLEAHVASWNGIAWHPLPNGPLEDAYALEVFDDGSGPQLYASARSEGENAVVRWDGSDWTTIVSGLTAAFALEAFGDGLAPGGSLYVGGSFLEIGGRVSSGLARWNDPCACGGQSYCTSGTTANGCVPTMSASGRASASASSPFVLFATQLEGQRSGHLFYGLSGPHAAPWGQSSYFLCVKAPTQRTGTQSTGGTIGQCDGEMALDWNAYVASHPGSLGVPFSAGAQVWVQGYFRDPPSTKTTALTNGLRFTLCP